MVGLVYLIEDPPLCTGVGVREPVDGAFVLAAGASADPLVAKYFVNSATVG